MALYIVILHMIGKRDSKDTRESNIAVYIVENTIYTVFKY